MSMQKRFILNLIFENKLIGKCSQCPLLYKVLQKEGKAMLAVFLAEMFKYHIRKKHFRRWPIYVSFIRTK